LLFSKQNAQPAGLNIVGLMTSPVSAPLEQGQSRSTISAGNGVCPDPDVAILTDKVEPLESFWGPRANVLLNGLAECSCVENMVRVVEQQLRPLDPPKHERVDRP
jgi:hypothetical protein